MAVMMLGCSHSNRQDYSSPDWYEPVFLTSPEDRELQHFNTEMYLYENLDWHLTGQTESTYNKISIESASLTASEEFLLTEGILPDSLTENELTGGINSNNRTEEATTNTYLYEWDEWRNANQPYHSVSYHVYTYYNPYDPYWFDPYWSYSRIRSYHYPFHPAYHYGGSLAYGYWYYPYHHYYYYYPYYPKKERETYTAEKPRESRTGVSRNASQRLTPTGLSSYSSLLRPPVSRTVPNPNTSQILNSPQRGEFSSRLRRETLIPTDRPNSLPRIRIEANFPSEYREQIRPENRPTMSFPNTRIAQPAPSRSGAGAVTSPRR